MLRLSGLDSDGMSDETRDAFVNMAENLGIEIDEAEDLIDLYLDEADKLSDPRGAAHRRGLPSYEPTRQAGLRAQRAVPDSTGGSGRPGDGPHSLRELCQFGRVPNAIRSLGRIYHGKRGA